MTSSRRFAGKVVLLTGAAGGFGRCLARHFAREGARLVLGDLRAEPLEAMAATLQAEGAEVETLAGDVAREATAVALVEQAQSRFGGLDIAVNNAGIVHPYAKLPDIDADAATRIIAVDLTGVIFALRQQIPALRRRGGGSIVNVASVAGLVGAPLLSVYAAAKHGVVGLTRSTAAEEAGRGIRINAVCPSFAATPMVTDMLPAMRSGPEAALARLVAAVPMRRLASAEEVAAAILYLAGPESGFITGQALAIDGGLSAV